MHGWGHYQKIIQKSMFCVFNKILRFEEAIIGQKYVTGGILMCQE